MPSLRAPAALLLVALAFGRDPGTRATADEPEGLRDRFRTEVLLEERRGPWRVWIERKSDQRTRALRTWTHLLRQGPGNAVPTTLVLDVNRLDPRFCLHESGWVVASGRDGVHVFPPPGWSSTLPSGWPDRTGLRTDLALSPSSRFLSDGFLSFGIAAPSSSIGAPTDAEPPRVYLRWAGLTERGLGGTATIAQFEGPALDVVAESQLLVSTTPEAPHEWRVTWMVPTRGGPIFGQGRIDRKQHWVQYLPAPKDPPTVRVAAVQCPSVLGDVAANRKRLAGLVEDAARQGAKVVVLPETAVTGYLSQDLKTTWHVPGRPRAPPFTEGRHPGTAAEDVSGASVSHFAALARRLGIYLTVPFLELDRSGASPRYFNTVCLVSPQGRVVAHYRKLNPWPHPEQSWAETGDKGLVTFDTPYGRVGLAICFDVHSVLKPYAEKSLWALLYPIAWVSESDEADATWFGSDLPLRVKSMGFHLVGANWSVDVPQPWHGYGHSLVVKRDGTVLASARTKVGAEIVYADLPVGR